MAWTRSPRGRRRFGGRRFFRRRRGLRPTTEQGGKVERCHFNFRLDQELTPGGGPVSDIIQIVGGRSLLGGLEAFGTQAEAVARMLQNPLRDFAVLAVHFDIVAFLSPGFVSIPAGDASLDYLEQYTQAGFAVNTQRLDGDGAPVTVPPYWLSQWPVNLTSGLTGFEEDLDYGTRTHFMRTGALAPHFVPEQGENARPTIDGFPRLSISKTVRVKRRISDDYALFFQFWNSNTGATTLESASIIWNVTGSLWYRMRF